MKVHVRANSTGTPFSICAAKLLSGGKVTKNNRQKRTSIEQGRIVSFSEFKLLESEAHCMNCVDQALIQRNRQRRAKGLPPVKSLFE